jgi:hypothetical protein
MTIPVAAYGLASNLASSGDRVSLSWADQKTAAIDG